MRIPNPRRDDGPLTIDQLFSRLLAVALGFILLSILDLAFGLVWFLFWSAYALFFLARWAVRQDRLEKEQNTVEKSLWAEMRDVARQIEAEEEAKKHPKKKSRRPKRVGKDGKPMPCIMCDEEANASGLYCDTHDV